MGKYATKLCCGLVAGISGKGACSLLKQLGWESYTYNEQGRAFTKEGHVHVRLLFVVLALHWIILGEK